MDISRTQLPLPAENCNLWTTVDILYVYPSPRKTVICGQLWTITFICEKTMNDFPFPRRKVESSARREKKCGHVDIPEVVHSCPQITVFRGDPYSLQSYLPPRLYISALTFIRLCR